MEDIEDIENIKTDAHLADILNKLKNSNKEQRNTDTVSKQEPTNDSSLTKEVTVSDVKTFHDVTLKKKDDIKANEEVIAPDLNDNNILPWFSKSDKDIRSIHYATFNDTGHLSYHSVKTDKPARDLASLKMKPDFACDIDYYNSKHYVLCIKQLDSAYHYSRSFTPDDVVEESKQVNDLRKLDADVIDLSNNDTYYHYVVFTDLGIADFLASKNDVGYPYSDPDLNKWFEETSNYVPLKNPDYKRNNIVVDDADMIREFKYDIITMHMPGIITLDSVDNEDPDYRVHIKLKDEFSFIPLNRILGCLRNYANDKSKSFNDFKRFIDTYFLISL